MAINGAGYAPGLIGQAFFVNGKNQYFSIPHTPSLSFTSGQPFTLEAWVYRTGGGLPFHVLGKRDSDYGSWCQLGYDNGYPLVPLNAWTHLVTTQDSTNAVSYYNGIPATARPARCPGPNSSDLQIGSSYAAAFFEGLIDEVRIYNRVLDPREIKAIYDAGTNGMLRPPAKDLPTRDPAPPAPTPSAAGMVAWWLADGDALDSVGSNNATLQQGAAYAVGRVGRAFALNGSGAFVRARYSPLWSFGSHAFTIELWASFRSTRDEQALLACDEGSGNYNKWIFWYNYGGLRLHINSRDHGGIDIVGPSFTPRLNHWYHLAITHRSTEYLFFMGGNLASIQTDDHPIPSITAPLTIGSAEEANFFQGLIDDVRIYNRALSPSEIRAIYDAGADGVCLPLAKSPVQGAGPIHPAPKNGELQTRRDVKP